MEQSLPHSKSFAKTKSMFASFFCFSVHHDIFSPYYYLHYQIVGVFFLAVRFNFYHIDGSESMLWRICLPFFYTQESDTFV